VAVDKNKLIMLEGPRQVLGKGESVNIMHPSLKIKGNLTDLDKQYVEAAQKVGLNQYMLSFVEGPEDGAALRKYHADAVIAEKIESVKGGKYVSEQYDSTNRLMFARGDYFVEVNRPHHILMAGEDIIQKDPQAIAASRILGSLAYGAEPSCQDITDVAYLWNIGYRTFMLGDEICQQRDSVIGALNLLEAIVKTR